MATVTKATITVEIKRSAAYQSAGGSVAVEVILTEGETLSDVIEGTTGEIRGQLFAMTDADLRDLVADAALLNAQTPRNGGRS